MDVKTITLPAMPPRIAKLPRHRIMGVDMPVPFFTTWLDEHGEPCPPGQGEPDFRVITGSKVGVCYRQKLCWVCGEPLGQYLAHVIGPMCAINRVSSEPSSHAACALFSVQACPFLTRPRMVRNRKDLPEQADNPAGFMIERNPGVALVWVTKTISAVRAHAGKAGVLFRLGDPTSVHWFAHGRGATRAEVIASIESGYPLLLEHARSDPMPGAVAELEQSRIKAMALLPAE